MYQLLHIQWCMFCIPASKHVPPSSSVEVLGGHDHTEYAMSHNGCALLKAGTLEATHTHTLHGVFSCSSCFACSLRADSNRETKVELTNVSFLRMKGLQSQFCVWKDSSPSMNKTNNHTPPDIKQLFTAGWLADLRQLTCAIWSTKRAEDWTHFWFCMAHIEVWMRRMLLSWTCFGTLRRDIKIHSFWLWPWDQINMQQGVSDSMMEKQHSVNISQDKWTTSELQCCSVCGSKLKGYFAT